ncbi:MAG: sodium-dependent transporter [Planctomycetota bacterium]
MAQASGGRESWGSRLGVILAVTGSAVGLGNFLRFPGLAAKYDGGAFMIPYFTAFLLLGLPICWIEWSMGRYGGARGFNSSPGIYRAIWRSRAAPYFGVLSMIIPVMIYMYYVYVEAWCLAYAGFYLSGKMELGNNARAYKDLFDTFIGKDGDGSAFFNAKGGLFDSVLIYLVICFVLNFTLIYRGLTKGIEWFCKLAMPALIVCAFIVLARVLTLGTPNPALPEQNLLNGLGYMWNPATEQTGFLESLGNPQMWLEAAGQIFFSLSVGFGIIITYASYLKKDDDIALSGLTAASGNEFCEVALGGMITIPAAFVFLGSTFLMDEQGKEVGTFGLGFVTLPNVFNQMYAGQFVGFVFFFLLFLAALTSSLSMLQPAIALLEEGLGLGRKASVALLGFITAMGAGFVVYFSKGLTAMDTIDFWVGTFGIYVLAMFQVFLFVWALGVDRGFQELDRGAEIRIPRFFRFVVMYLTPLYLLAIFVAWCGKQLSEGGMVAMTFQNPVAAMSVGFIAVVAALFALLISQSVRRWRAMERKGGES